MSQNTGNYGDDIISAISNGFFPIIFAGFFCNVYLDKSKWPTKYLAEKMSELFKLYSYKLYNAILTS